MIRYILARLAGETKNELARRLLEIPRLTGDQLLHAAREKANTYLKKLQITPLDDQSFEEIKVALRRPIDSQESAEDLASDINEIFEDFFDRTEFEEPSPLHDNRWHLALMSKTNYVMCINALNTVSQRFQQVRSQWVQSQLAAIQEDMQEDIDHEQEFLDHTKDLLANFNDEPAEA